MGDRLLLLVVTLAAVLALAVRRRYVVIAVSGTSMLPALADGDRVLVRRAGLGRVRPGDVVVIENPGDDFGWQPAGVPVSGKDWLVKRAVALPGDPLPALIRAAWPAAAARVPPGVFVVLSDNLDGGFDSYGPAGQAAQVPSSVSRARRPVRGVGRS